MAEVIRRFEADVESIKHITPPSPTFGKQQGFTFEVRARTTDKAPGTAASVFFEMGNPDLAPLIGEGLIITVENQRTPTN